MKTIEIEDDVYQHLLQNTRQIGESASQILRRLLSISTEQNQAGMPVETSRSELSDCLDAPAYKAQPDVTRKFLHILSYVHDEKGEEEFKKVLAISGRRRKYFALTEEELGESGKSVYPKQIPNSKLWVITNNDTPKKRRMVNDVLKILGYSDLAVKQAIKALV